ncbi:MAG: NUDIX hydrolase, partial [Aggregatilineales bacterium]
DTLAREVKEEIDADVCDLRYLGTLENIFTYNGKPGHELVMLFDGAFVDEFRNQDDYVVEGMNGERSLYIAEWKPLSFFRGDDAPPLYPNGLLALLDES